MSKGNFEFEVIYDGLTYTGAVKPGISAHQTTYTVLLECPEQHFSEMLLLKPSASTLYEWEYECPGKKNASDRYDQEFLDAIGDQVEVCLRGDIFPVARKKDARRTPGIHEFRKSNKMK
jgi:hypothetical protein